MQPDWVCENGSEPTAENVMFNIEVASMTTTMVDVTLVLAMSVANTRSTTIRMVTMHTKLSMMRTTHVRNK